MSIFDAIMNLKNGRTLATKLGLQFICWKRSAVSESTYCYMADRYFGVTVKVRFAAHEDKHFDSSESLGTVDITDFAEFDPTAFGQDDVTYTLKEQVREDYWIQRHDRFENIHTSIVARLKTRLYEIIQQTK